MDSLSQIVLGAAVGEAVLGKKIGNRAMLLGAAGGTLPDLDVVANLFMSPMNAMDFHRGITHSIPFAVFAPLAFGGFSYFFYKKNVHKSKWYRTISSILLYVLIVAVLGSAGYAALTTQTWWALGISIFLILLLLFVIIRYIASEPESYQVSFLRWYMFFFLVFATHTLLDVFTTYGTQVLMPFSNYRAAFASISVVDPIYTLPFLLFVCLAAFFRHTSAFRAFLNWTGIILSTGYLVFTLITKDSINRIFEKSLEVRNLDYERYQTSPSMFNSILWSGTIEADSVYYVGAYSKFDPQKIVQRFREIPKNHHLLKGHENDEHILILKRFSDDYFTIQQDTLTGKLTFVDLRWGALSNVAKSVEGIDFPLIFHLRKENGQMVAEEHREPPSGITREMLESYWDRIMGRWQ